MVTRSRLQEVRKGRGLTQAELARRVGLSLGWLRTLEAAPTLGSPHTIARLAAELGIDPAELLAAQAAFRCGTVR